MIFRDLAEKVFFRRVISKYMLSILLAIVIYLIIGIPRGYVHNWLLIFKVEYINDYLSSNKLESVINFLKYFVIFSGGLSILGLFVLCSKDKFSLLLSFVTIGYLLVVLGGGYKGMHYLMPIVLLPLITILRYLKGLSIKKFSLLSMSYAAGVLLLIACSWPKVYRVHDDYRRYGEKTCLLFDSYNEIEKMKDFFKLQDERALVRYGSLQDESWWEKDSVMMWLFYADVTRSLDKEYDFYFSKENKLPALDVQLYSSDGKYYFWGKKDISHINNNIPTDKEIFSDLFKDLIDLSA